VNVAVATAAKSIVSQRVILAREGRNPWLVARMRSGWLVMSDTQVVPGQLILLSDPVVGSLNDLDAGQRALFLADMALAGDALLAVTGCLRVNYDILGNSDPALHAHIVPRYASEPEERRRMPIWLYDWGTAERFSEQTHGPLRRELADAVAPLS
jgi:diadenosine tetraphosphate (Ap4A) HIT family hydrolase